MAEKNAETVAHWEAAAKMLEAAGLFGTPGFSDAIVAYYDRIRRNRQAREDRMRWEDDGGPVIADEPIDGHADGATWQLQRRGMVHHPVAVTPELLLLRKLVRCILELRSEVGRKPPSIEEVQRLRSLMLEGEAAIAEYHRRFGHLVDSTGLIGVAPFFLV